MPILVAGWLDFPPDSVATMLHEAEPLIVAALAEQGCRAYSWALDPITPGRVQVFEQWDSEADLQAHFDASPYAAMGAHLQANGMGAFSVSKYRSDLAEPVYDESGTPRADFFTA